MRAKSVYEVECVCGNYVESETKTTKCGKCGRILVLNWSAEERKDDDSH